MKCQTLTSYMNCKGIHSIILFLDVFLPTLRLPPRRRPMAFNATALVVKALSKGSKRKGGGHCELCMAEV